MDFQTLCTHDFYARVSGRRGCGERSVAEALRREFRRSEGGTYLDHAAATLFPESAVRNFCEDVSSNLYGNPHSRSPSSRLTHDSVERVRLRILQFFDADPEQYSVVFTSGCTSALRLVAESFPWRRGSVFSYLTDSHTSVVGVRGVASALGAVTLPVAPDDLTDGSEDAADGDDSCRTPHLFSFPAQSNFSGRKYPLSCVTGIRARRLYPACAHRGQWRVLLDAASFVCTSPLSLRQVQADFVPVSFYKLLGFPTGLGALLARSDAAAALQKRYFGGGTAAAYLSGEDYYVEARSTSDRLEDGTISFLDVIALNHSFDALHKLTGGMRSVQQHTFALARYTYLVLSSLRHGSGRPLAQVYAHGHFESASSQGPILTFNLLDAQGGFIGYSQVDRMASLYNIHLRTGCFCNTGACQAFLGISSEQMKSNLQAGHVCGDAVDLVDGRPTGAVRVSFGYMSTFHDCQNLLTFVVECFCSGAVSVDGERIEAALRHATSPSARGPITDEDWDEPQREDRDEPQRESQSHRDEGEEPQRESQSCRDEGEEPQRESQSHRDEEPQRESQSHRDEGEEPQRESQSHRDEGEEPQRESQSHRDEGEEPQRESQSHRDEEPQRESQSHRDEGEEPQRESQSHRDEGEEPQRESQSHRDEGEEPQRESQSHRDEEPQRESQSHRDEGEEPQRESQSHRDEGEEPQRESQSCRDEGEEPQRESQSCRDEGEEPQRESQSHRDEGEEPQRESQSHRDEGEEPQRESQSHKDKGEEPQRESQSQRGGAYTLAKIYIYPVKSCGAFEVERWPLGPRGLLYDRGWMVVNGNGVCLSQKREARLCLIKPRVQLSSNRLQLLAPGMDSVSVPLETEAQSQICLSKVCGDRVETLDCGDGVADWLSRFLGQTSRLIRLSPDFTRGARKRPGAAAASEASGVSASEASLSPLNEAEVSASLSLVNEAQYLMINGASVERIQRLVQRREQDLDLQNIISRFRANLVLAGGGGAFEEDEWTHVSIGDARFTVSGPCGRCHMVGVDQESGARTREPLLSLSELRGQRKVTFGVYLSHALPENSRTPAFLCSGSSVRPDSPPRPEEKLCQN